MKFSFNKQIVPNALTDDGRALLTQYFFGQQSLTALQLYFHLIDSINFINVTAQDTLYNHQWQLFGNTPLLWTPSLFLFDANNTYITDFDIQSITMTKSGTVQGACLMTNDILFSVATLATPQQVKIGDQVEIGYTLDW